MIFIDDYYDLCKILPLNGGDPSIIIGQGFSEQYSSYLTVFESDISKLVARDLVPAFPGAT